MKFNHKKWDSIVQRKKRLHDELSRVTDDFRFEKINYTNSEDFFLKNYGYDSSGKRNGIAARLLSDKELSSIALIDRIEQIKESWAVLCAEYGLSVDRDDIGRRISELLNKYLAVKKLMEMKEGIQNEVYQYGASYNVLESFARSHVKVSNIVSSAIEVGNQQTGGYF